MMRSPFVLALLALLSLASAPAGFMPMRGPGGGFVLAICPGVSTAPMMAPASMGDMAHGGMRHGEPGGKPGSDGTKAGHPCPYAFAAAVALPDALALALATPIPIPPRGRAERPWTRFGPSGLPPATGPPA